MSLEIVNNGTESVMRYNTYYGESLPGKDQRFLVQYNILEPEKFYIIELVTSNYILATDVIFSSLYDSPTFSVQGQHYIIAKSRSTTLAIFFDNEDPTIGQTYQVDLNYVRVRPVPTYTLKKCEDDSVIKSFAISDITQGSTYVSETETTYDDYLKLSIDLSDVEAGVYYLEFTDEGVVYQTASFNVQLDHDCTIQLEWGGTSNAFDFNYSTLDYSQSLRVEAKLHRPSYAFDRNEIFRDSKGTRILNYIRQDRAKTLTIAEMPEYCHNALSLGIKHDEFTIDGADYVCEDDDYSPSWRKSSESAPVEIEVKKQDQNLVNSNCN